MPAPGWPSSSIAILPVELAGSPAWSPDGTEQGDYRRGDVIVGTVVVTGVHERYGEPPYRIVMTTSHAGQPTLHIGPDEPVTW